MHVVFVVLLLFIAGCEGSLHARVGAGEDGGPGPRPVPERDAGGGGPVIPPPPGDDVGPPGGEGEPSTRLNVTLNVSRTVGVAPLAVAFDALGTTHTEVGRAYHDLRYEWHFNDDAGAWTHSERSRSTALGPVTGHVFERPGRYEVQLTVRDADGGWSLQSATIDVQDPAEIFAGDRTLCFSSSGDFAGCPAGAVQQTTDSFDDVGAEIARGRRLLLRRGDTFESTVDTIIRTEGPGIIGAFGEGDLPLVRRTRLGSVLVLSIGDAQMSDWRLVDLAFEGVPESRIVSAAGRVHRFLALRLRGVGFDQFVAATVGVVASNGLPMHTELAVVDCDFERIGHVGLFLAGEQMLILGNRIVDSRDEHIIRTHNLTRSVIAHNYLGGATFGNELLKLAGMCTIASESSGCNGEAESPYGRDPVQHFVVADNVLVGGQNLWDVVVGPQSSSYDERLVDGIVERNRFVGSGETQVALNVFASRLSVRDNLFDLSASGRARAVSVSQRGVEPVPTDNAVYRNVCVGAGACVHVDSVAQNTTTFDNEDR